MSQNPKVLLTHREVPRTERRANIEVLHDTIRTI